MFSSCGGGDCRVLAVLRPGVHVWNLAEVLVCFFLHVHLCVVFARAVSSLVHVFSLTCRTGGLTSMAATPGMCRPSCGTRPCGTPTGPRNRFPTQSVLRTCLGTSYLVGIILIACG